MAKCKAIPMGGSNPVDVETGEVLRTDAEKYRVTDEHELVDDDGEILAEAEVMEDESEGDEETEE